MPRVVNEKCGFTEGYLKEQTEAPKPNVCGAAKNSGLIFGGENFDRGDFPWMVALYRKIKRNRPEYICGGSVISDRHVLTAAHCLDAEESQVVIVVFGAYELRDPSEDGRFARSPSKIFKHDHWNKDAKFYADIAMLLMPEKFAFSTFVQPICLWESDNEMKIPNGIVAGWGASEGDNPVGSIPTKVLLLISNSDECNAAEHAFCTGIADGRGPCGGDSGSGFIVHSGDAFYLKGIVSNALHGIFCEHNKFVIFTDVLKFKKWIDETMKRT